MAVEDVHAYSYLLSYIIYIYLILSYLIVAYEQNDGELMEIEDVHAYLNIIDKIPGANKLINKIKPFLKANKVRNVWFNRVENPTIGSRI